MFLFRRHCPLLRRVEEEGEGHCVHWKSRKRCSCSLNSTLKIECMHSISRHFVVVSKAGNNAASLCTLRILFDTAEIMQLLQSKSPLNSRFIDRQSSENATCAATIYSTSDCIDRMRVSWTEGMQELIGDGDSRLMLQLKAWS